MLEWYEPRPAYYVEPGISEWVHAQRTGFLPVHAAQCFKQWFSESHYMEPDKFAEFSQECFSRVANALEPYFKV